MRSGGRGFIVEWVKGRSRRRVWMRFEVDAGELLDKIMEGLEYYRVSEVRVRRQ